MRLVLATLFLFMTPGLFAQFNPNPNPNPVNPTNPTNPGTTNLSQLWTVLNASNVTGRLPGEINAAITTIHGGLAGEDTGGCASGTASIDSTCNNCGAGGTAPCNTVRIHNNLRLTIAFRPQSTVTNVLAAGPVYVTDIQNQGAGQKVLQVAKQTPSGLIVPGLNPRVDIEIRWGEICEVLFNPSSDGMECESPNLEFGTQPIRIGIDEFADGAFNEATVTEVSISLSKLNLPAVDLCTKEGTNPVTGACNFVAYPGDSKVFIQGVKTDSNFPSVSGSTVDRVRVFYEKYTDATTVKTPDSSSPKTDLVLEGSSSNCTGSVCEAEFVNNEVTGLENGSTYRFSLGLLDVANNLGGIIDMTGNVDPENTDDCYTVDASYPLNCHTASPDQVIALIEKEFDCFITTATYGTPFRPKVKDFRAFRNRYLHPHWLGRKIIGFYYRNSPPVAQWIRTHPWSKPIMRGVLWPLWAFAKLALISPLLLLVMFISIAFVWQWSRRRKGTAP